LVKLFVKSWSFWRRFGTRAFIARVHNALTRKVEQTAVAVPFIHTPAPVKKTSDTVREARFEQLTPLRSCQLPHGDRARVNIVTDSIGAGSLFGGVGTALLLAATLANRLGADLRIITRTERPQPENVGHIFSAYGVTLQGETQFRFIPSYDLKQDLDFAPGELFITTSWWTTAATLPAVPPSAILYLLQEDERMFYPYGDDRLRCEQLLRNRDIRFAINTKLLFDHFVAEGFDNIAQHAQWFEPSFPPQVFKPAAPATPGKRKFVFYARPNNLRNLFYFGLQVIEAAVARGVLDLALWDIVFVGKDIPEMALNNGYAPARFENLAWTDYAALVGSADLGFTLMYTPHPSYPPLDLVASGAVAVTNRFANKQDLSAYSPNLICAELELDALVEALRQGVALAGDATQRQRNFEASGLMRDWNQSFAGLVQQVAPVAAS
jgi:hypothetical protein